MSPLVRFDRVEPIVTIIVLKARSNIPGAATTNKILDFLFLLDRRVCYRIKIQFSSLLSRDSTLLFGLRHAAFLAEVIGVIFVIFLGGSI